ncbi:DNA replication licensing factor MCM7 [Gracilariopsis chorda]|uniref:DNA replication licensing factor MCM7 n=1 Tax=Gracilariopsis chorda TaxID=448386 RepID=A0A2V3IPJ6_9FLOR|nr:DNA replication licensing factor MCM7 [Gracilariopsis chorda]|eukprot:PXF44006.1 DNA replication licensing factor MCM7 [Gracilariopsis chorda]
MATLATPPSARARPSQPNDFNTPPTLDYAVIRQRLKEFLSSFAHDDFSAGSSLKYMNQINEIYSRTRNSLVIYVDDVYKWGLDASNFAASNSGGIATLLHEEIVGNARRYKELFSEAADEIIDQLRAVDPSPTLTTHGAPDRIDALAETRRQREEHFREAQLQAENLAASNNADNANQPAGPAADPRNLVPAAMTRLFDVLLIPQPTEKPIPLRMVRSEHVGRLLTVTGIVTRITEVKPRVEVATYTCHSCGYEVYQQVGGKTYMPVLSCPTQNHQRGQNNELIPNYKACKFVKYQELKLQEPADQVPIGSIPRTINVKLNAELTRTCTSGDSVDISGIFLPAPFTGYLAVKAGFLANTFLEATHVVQKKKTYDETVLDDETKAELEALRVDSDVYGKLAKSIAPEIFGNVDVKKALLLLLLGAPPKRLPDGMRLRGDIHICLMGEPGVAKSQLLKHIAKVAPRSVYTNGKGSSGVGLTAAIMRDPVTKELMLEGGALVLSDMGIACIDEFDKMNEVDRTAIHEVMEQQTVSIAKAGITTSLNARASILAAANPAYGRYNKNKTPAENINLPAALLSRFDLLFLLLDNPSYDHDIHLARHVAHVHRTGAHPPLGFTAISPKAIRAHIAAARKVQPVVPKSGLITDFLVNSYVSMRAENTEEGRDAQGYTSPRKLLSILRLAQALCRLRLAERVEKEDLDEALRLMNASQASLGDGKSGNRRRNEDDESDMDPFDNRFGEDEDSEENKIWRLYTLISEHMEKSNRTVIDIDAAEKVCDDNGFSRDVLVKTIEQYEDLNLWVYDHVEHRIRLV